MDKMRLDKSDWLVVCDGRKVLQGEVGKDLVKLPAYEIEKQLLMSGAPR
nr:host attachment protein [Bradyrhizobium sp. 1]